MNAHQSPQHVPLPGPLLVLGSTGMAGSAIMAAAAARGVNAIGLSRSSQGRNLDVANIVELRETLGDIKPACIINTVAVVSVDLCEKDPGQAWVVNARPVAVLADYANATGARLIHVSTDHYFSGGGRRRQSESAPVVLLNEYARTKFAAEQLAMVCPTALVARTNIVGLTGRKGGSFAEWCIDAIQNNRDVTLFTDQYVSSIDIWSFAECLLDLADMTCSGILNIGSSDVFAKSDFAKTMAIRLGMSHSNAKFGQVSSQVTRRPDSLGLDVSKVENLLGRKMPGLLDVVNAVCSHL
jgi:dTDP-4-dehydrorhamnose reductase